MYIHVLIHPGWFIVFCNVKLENNISWCISSGYTTSSFLSCSSPVRLSMVKMFLRTLWSRLGAQLPVERKPVFTCASASLSQSVQPHKYESKPRTNSNSSGPWVCFLNPLHQQQKHIRHVLPTLGGIESLSSALLTDPGLLAKCRSEQKRFYSSNLVKSVLKPTLKPATVPGKRVPKGPRTKQPSRANQPSLSEDKVIQPVIRLITDLFKW